MPWLPLLYACSFSLVDLPNVLRNNGSISAIGNDLVLLGTNIIIQGASSLTTQQHIGLALVYYLGATEIPIDKAYNTIPYSNHIY